MKSITIDGRNFTYKTIDVKQTIDPTGINKYGMSMDITFERSKVDEKFLLNLFDRQMDNYKSDYKFDVSYPLGTFYKCLIPTMDMSKDEIIMNISADYNNAKQLKEYRNEIIKDILSTSTEQDDIKTNNNQ